MRNTALIRNLAIIEERMEQQRQLVRRVEQQEAEIRADPELTEEQRRHRISQARLDGQAKSRKLMADITNARDAVLEAAKAEHSLHKIDPVAQARVRDLLARKVTPAAIREQARREEDDNMLVALRSEVRYFDLDGEFGATRGR